MKRWGFCGLLFALVVSTFSVMAADWPQWRGDAQHSGFSPAALPAEMKLLWKREFSPRQQAWPSPLNQYLMQFDRQFEPVVMHNVMLLAFNDADKVVGIDVKTGKSLWTFFTNGPVRLAPALYNGRAYISCDDGFLYCVKVSDGSLLWKFDAAPDRRHVLGNRRIISMWPIRGGAVVEDGRLYFSAGIWPFMGVFLYCIDAESGKEIWVNDYDCISYRNQPHMTKAFGGIAPQGVTSIKNNYLFAPGGRSVPGVYDAETGKEKYYLFAEYSKNYGGDFVAVGDKSHFVRARDRRGNPVYQAFDNKTGKVIKKSVEKSVPVIRGNSVFSAPSDLKAEDTIIAGKTAYVGGEGFIAALDAGESRELWKKEVEGDVVRLLAASDRLFAVTLEGNILCYGASEVQNVGTDLNLAAIPLKPSVDAVGQLKKIKAAASLNGGYALVWGIGDGALLEALAANSDYSVIAVDASVKKVSAMRRKLDEAGLYGDKVSVHNAPDWKFDVPAYIMSVVVVNRPADLWKSVRPYGGVMCTRKNLRVKEGALEGAASWTHNYCDIGQSVKSDDKLVKAPMKPLWWGGEAPNTDVLPRHGHGPGELVIGGRLFIQGIDCLSARDVYTGRVLWKSNFPGLNKSGVFFNSTFKSNPMAVGYNQIHLPGANLRGGNYAATTDRIYLIRDKECLVIDTATGKTLSVFKLPDDQEWGYIGVQGDLLIAGGEFVKLSHLTKDPAGLSAKKKVFAGLPFDRSSSKRLYALDRISGKVRWHIESKFGFLHNAICASADKLFCIDRYPYYIERHLQIHGEKTPAGSYVLNAVDFKTGKIKWTDADEVFGTYLSYSSEHNALVMSYRPSRDSPLQPGKKMIAVYNAEDGRELWNKQVDYTTFPLTHNDYLFTRSGAWRITDGEELMVSDPLTGKKIRWAGYRTGHGCNYPVASENLLTFRSSTASFYDLNTLDGISSFGGFKSGCSANLIAADGVLNAPDYTFTCSCAFQTQSSIALIHDPTVDYWSAYDTPRNDKKLQRFSINLGAPGDRRHGKSIWMNYPNLDGATPAVPVRILGDARWILHHPLRYGSQDLRWVYSSCLAGATTFEMATGGVDKNNQQSKAGNGSRDKNFKPADDSADFTVRLYFAEPDEIKAGQRVFDVALNGNKVLSGFDVVKEAGKARKGVMKEFKGVLCKGSVKVDFTSNSKLPAILSGIEIVRED